MSDAQYITPALAAYTDRIGAEQINFRKYMVKKFLKGNYYTERAFITISRDGVVECSDPDLAPTEQEQELIAAELASINFPHSIKASDVTELLPLLKSSIWDEFIDPDDNDLIVMVQERREQPDGGKFFIPWSKFSDGVWRSMEPDGKLPLWRPRLKQEQRRAMVMIHEGVKAAKAVNRIVAGREPHPWREELELYEHWGAIGGAMAPARIDYGPLKRKKPPMVVYVCDHDEVGERALSMVSRMYRDPLKGVMFNDQFPDSWDMADELPAKMFSEAGYYLGPQLSELMEPATWATTWGQPNARGKRELEVSLNFLAEWRHCCEPAVYFNVDRPQWLMTRQGFEDYSAPFTDIPPASKLSLAKMLAKNKSNKMDFLCYEPGEPSGVMVGRRFNVHVPTKIKIARDGTSYACFEDYVGGLLPVPDDRLEVCRWFATLIARPGIKMSYGLMMYSDAHGVGKSTLIEKIGAPLVGMSNYSPASEDSLAGGWTDWCTEKRLICVHEIFAGDSYGKLYDKLKSMITEEWVEVRKKFLANYTVRNHAHMALLSNVGKALKIPNGDRRWLVPKVTEHKQPLSFFQRLNRWLQREGGLSAVLLWGEEYIDKHGAVQVGASAPFTSAKQEMVVAGYSEELLQARHIMLSVRDDANGVPTAFLDTDVATAVNSRNRFSKYPLKPLSVRKVAEAEGLFVSDDTVWVADWKTCTKHSRLIVVQRELLELVKDRAQLKARITPIPLEALEGKLTM